MNLDSYIKKLDTLIRHKFSKDSCHDIYHLYRVYYLSLKIQEKEGGDKLVIGVAAFLHDIHRIMQAETGKYVYPKESLETIKPLLVQVKFPKNKIDKILHVIEYHEEYSFSKNGKTVNDIETLIVQDADNLDAIGAIGIGRTFSFNTRTNRPMWDPSEPFIKTYYSEENPPEPSTLHHFHYKLLKLKDNMNTKTAKKIANHRHKYLKEFIKEFISEWYGKL
ncbi:MAG: HD domain-containing protein [Candidatus Woesearchaeota archaeon]